MEVQAILSFSLAAILMALMPGPDNLYVITESISRGSRRGILIAAGLNFGVIFHTAAAATGLSLILKESELAFKIIQIAGALYLFYLAYGAYKEEASKPDTVAQIELKSRWKVFRRGLIMNLMNPKVSLFFIAFLPQFVDTEATYSVAIQMMVFGSLFMLYGFLCFASFAVLAGTLNQHLQKPGFWKYAKWLKVFVLLGMAIYLLLPN